MILKFLNCENRKHFFENAVNTITTIRDLHDLHSTAVDASTAKAAKYSHATRQTINQGRSTQISRQKAWLLVDAQERDLMSLTTENTILI